MLQAEVALLREQIATRKPQGGRPRTDDKKLAQIEADLAAGCATGCYCDGEVRGARTG